MAEEKETKQEEKKVEVKEVSKSVKKIPEKKSEPEQEYVIPLRRRYQHVARYKKTPKAVKTIKEFLVRHMKIYDRDLNKIKIDKYLNEFLWFRGIKKPPYKIKVKVKKDGENVRVELVEMPDKLKFKKLREDKIESEALAKRESKKGLMQKAKEGLKGRKSEDEDNDGVEDKNEEKEKKESVKEAGAKLEKDFAKKMKHSVGGKTKQPKRQQRKALAK